MDALNQLLQKQEIMSGKRITVLERRDIIYNSNLRNNKFDIIADPKGRERPKFVTFGVNQFVQENSMLN